jgi:hypothetical protein
MKTLTSLSYTVGSYKVFISKTRFTMHAEGPVKVLPEKYNPRVYMEEKPSKLLKNYSTKRCSDVNTIYRLSIARSYFTVS